MANTETQERDKARVIRRLHQIDVCLRQAGDTAASNIVKQDALDEARGLTGLAIDAMNGLDTGGGIVNFMRGESA